MHIKFPETVDNTLRYLKLKLLPKTLFFRTMLLIFIPLIVVQVVSIFVFFDSNWWRVGAACPITWFPTWTLPWS